MKRGFGAIAAALAVAGCVTTAEPQYALTGGETGVFRSANAGKAIPLDHIKGMDEKQLQATFGAPQMDRRDATTRVLRYTSDACILFVFVQGSRAAYADAYDPHLRPLKPIDQCAGSVATQKRNIS